MGHRREQAGPTLKLDEGMSFERLGGSDPEADVAGRGPLRPDGCANLGLPGRLSSQARRRMYGLAAFARGGATRS